MTNRVTLAPNYNDLEYFTFEGEVEKGEYPFECNVLCGSGHADMNGMFIVE